MKRMLKGLCALLLACGLAVSAAAEETAPADGAASPIAEATAAPTASPAPTAAPTPTPAPTATATPAPAATPTPTPVQSGTGVYVVAATVTDRSGGEIAKIAWGDVVNVVLKVVDHSSARLHVEAGDIAARVNSSVFTYTGLGEISQLYEGTDQDGDYYGYVLLFRDVIYNGGGNTFPVDLSYPDSSKPMQQFSVTLGQCVDKDPNDPSKARTPNLVVREANYGANAVVAGTPFTLNLTVYASTGSEDLSDVVVSLNLPDGVTLGGGSLSSYLGSMPPRSTRQVSFQVLVSSSFTNGVANIGVKMDGTGAASSNAAAGDTTISVPISQEDRFELGQLQVTDGLTVGSTGSVTLSYVNKGKKAISNLEAVLEGDGLGADVSQQYLGNLNPGTEGSVDFDLMPSAAGTHHGAIKLTYEDPNGVIKTLTQEFTVEVGEEIIYDMPIDPNFTPEPVRTGPPVWVWPVGGAAAVGAAVFGVRLVKKRRAAKKLARLEDDADEDL